MEDDEPRLPCEFCTEVIPASRLIAHQLLCQQGLPDEARRTAGDANANAGGGARLRRENLLGPRGQGQMRALRAANLLNIDPTRVPPVVNPAAAVAATEADGDAEGQQNREARELRRGARAAA